MKLSKLIFTIFCASVLFAGCNTVNNEPDNMEGQTVMLCFGGIDCLADIWLNGKHPVIAVNDTRGEKHGTITVHDTDYERWYKKLYKNVKISQVK